MKKAAVIAEPGKQAIITSYTLDAPADRVFKAYTDPELLPKWWGRGTVVDKMEVRTGGSWRFVQHDENGENAFHGVYHLVSPTMIISTFEWEGLPNHVFMETLTLEEHDGQTTFRTVSVFQSVEDRDGMLQSGMEEGQDATMAALAELVENQ